MSNYVAVTSAGGNWRDESKVHAAKRGTGELSSGPVSYRNAERFRSLCGQRFLLPSTAHGSILSAGVEPIDWTEVPDVGPWAGCGTCARIVPRRAGEDAKARLEQLREVLRAENISYGELAELQGLARYIEPGDVELLEAAGVPEFPEEEVMK